VAAHGGLAFDEILEVTTLIEVELIAQAAQSGSAEQIQRMQVLSSQIDSCDTAEKRIAFERAFEYLLFEIIKRPLMALLSRAANELYGSHSRPPLFVGASGVKVWMEQRKRVVRAICERDVEAARFEAERHRRAMLDRLRLPQAEGSEGGSPA